MLPGVALVGLVLLYTAENFGFGHVLIDELFAEPLLRVPSLALPPFQVCRRLLTLCAILYNHELGQHGIDVTHAR